MVGAGVAELGLERGGEGLFFALEHGQVKARRAGGTSVVIRPTVRGASSVMAGG